MYADFAQNLFQFGKCNGISSEIEKAVSDTERRLPYYIGYKVLSAIPLCAFLSFIVTSLTYRTIINILDWYYRSPDIKSHLSEKHFDSFCCNIFNVDDDDEIIYNYTDINYVLDLILRNKKKPLVESGISVNDVDINAFENYYTHSKIIVKKKSKFSKILSKIYDFEKNFRFSSRFVNALCVALVALYYFFI